jgi:D-3-phosphoglycerate dehydrogenase
MYTIKTLNKISPLGLNRLDAKVFTVDDNAALPEGILVRSADMLQMEMPQSLLAIGRAGAGTNNIPSDRCAEQGIVVFNTPGANANAVKELAVCALLLSSRNIFGGITWCQGLTDGETTVDKQVEKGKSAFVGPEIMGKTLGVIGLGAIGRLVAEAARGLGMTIVGYDPFVKELEGVELVDLDTLYAKSDYITLHVPQTAETKGMINAQSIAKMKDGVRILNLARGTLVNNADILSALDAGKVACYVTDFPSSEVVGKKGVVTIPHLGASTPEAEDNCAMMACDEVADYLCNGNIKNSVNLPNCTLPRQGGARLTVLSKGADADKIAEIVGNATASASATRGDYTYTIFDGVDGISAAVETVAMLPGVIRVRAL